jgi:hypothetical protein
MKSLEIAAAFAAVFAAFLIKLLRIGRREKGLPPGPPTVPILGNLHLFPKEHGHHRCDPSQFSILIALSYRVLQVFGMGSTIRRYLFSE